MNKKYKIISIISSLLISFSSLKAMDYSVNKNFLNYNLIYASGKIRHGDLYKLRRTYNRLPKNRQTIVVFNSGGGELNEGLRIGEFLKANHIGSAVRKNGICASSCGLAFLGGRDFYGRKLMILPRSSKLGFHSFYYRNSDYVRLSKVEADLSNVLNYANYVGAPTSLVAKMFNTKSSSMYWVNRRDKKMLGIVSGLKRVSFSNKYAGNKIHYKKATTYSTYKMTQTTYIKDYFSKVNSAITANRGVVFGNEIALNDSSYQSWLSSKLRYAYLKNTKLIARNKVQAEVIYALRNGQRVCSRNIYHLAQNSYGWKIVSRSHRPCNYSSRKVLKRIGRTLP